MTKLVNRAKMTTATTGTGTITLGSAVSGYQSFADAGVADADVVRYTIEDGTAWEIGTGTYTASGTTLSRTPSESSNADAAINLSGNAVVFVTAAAADIVQPDSADITGDLTIADKIVHSGDTNTAIRFPAADTVTVETSGAERLRVDSSGNVGIGLTAPTDPLHITRDISAALQSSVRLNAAYTAGGLSHGVGFSINSNAVSAGVYVTENNGPGVSLLFTTSPSFSTPTNTERMRITSAGNVGIGKTNPATLLDVNGTVTATGWSGGGIVTETATQTLTNKTLTAPTVTGAVLNDGYTEEVFAVTGTTPALSPTNGSIQTWTLSGNSTPTAGTWAAGQSITLMVDDGTDYTITWTSVAVTWKTDGGTAPTLNTSGETAITLWKVGTTIYGARVGDA